MPTGQSVSQIRIGSNGSIKVAPVGTTAPTDIATAWGAGWIDLGYATDAGVQITDGKTVNEIRVWQLKYAARRAITARTFDVTFTLTQWNAETVKLGFGGGTITPTTGPPAYYTYTPPATEFIDQRALGVEWKDGTNIYRLVLFNGMVTDNVSTTADQQNAMGLPITFSLLGADGAQPYALITNDPAWA